MTPEKKRQWREDCDRTRHEVVRALAENVDAIEELTVVLGDYFARAIEGKTFDRKPPLALRIPLQGEPAGRLVCFPQWSARSKKVNAQVIQAEVLLDRVARSRDCALRLLLREVPHAQQALWLLDGRVWLRNWSIKHGAAAAHRLTGVVRACSLPQSRLSHCPVSGAAAVGALDGCDLAGPRHRAGMPQHDQRFPWRHAAPEDSRLTGKGERDDGTTTTPRSLAATEADRVDKGRPEVQPLRAADIGGDDAAPHRPVAERHEQGQEPPLPLPQVLRPEHAASGHDGEGAGETGSSAWTGKTTSGRTTTRPR